MPKFGSLNDLFVYSAHIQIVHCMCVVCVACSITSGHRYILQFYHHLWTYLYRCFCWLYIYFVKCTIHVHVHVTTKTCLYMYQVCVCNDIDQ